VNASEIRDVLYSEILDGDALPWKLASWGSTKDKKLLLSVTSRFPSLRKIEEDGLIFVSEGMQLRKRPKQSSGDTLEDHPELAGRAILNVNRLKRRRGLFHLPANVLDIIPADRVFVRKRGGLRS
jgi:hypothetical protein